MIREILLIIGAGAQNHIAVLKLKRNEPLTVLDLSELEKVFVAAGAEQSEIAQVRAGGGLGLFVRSLVGLERDAAKKSFRGISRRQVADG